MSTGYTDRIKDGITFREYALDCSKAFLMHYREAPRDTPIDPEDFKPSNHYKREIARAEKSIKKINSLSDVELEQELTIQYQKELKDYNKMLQETEDLEEKYVNMLQEVRSYVPPTPEHNELRNFMKTQILESIEHDCDTTYNTEPTKMSARGYKIIMLESHIDSLKYYKERYKEELEKTNQTKKWVTDFLNSLPEE